MTDQASQNAKGGEQQPLEVHEPVSAGQLNERTAKRQRMLLAGIATVILAGTSWIIFGSDHSKKAHPEGEAETIETASLVNRNLSQREFTTVYGNQLGAVTREQKALKEGAVMRPEMEAELAALKAENQAMRTDGQAAIDAISAENEALKNQLQSQTSTPAPNAAAKSLNLGVIEYEPHDLIALLDDLTSPTTAPQDDAVPYNPNDPIANQAIRRDIELLVHEDRIELGTERFRPTGVHNQGVPEIGAVYPDRFDLRHFAVRNMPPRWAPHECARLIGDLFTDKLRFPCPAATMLCLVYPDQDAAAAKAGFKFMRTTSLSQTRSARFLPRIAEQSAEWQHVQAELQEGRRLVRVFYGITTWSPLGQGDRHERAVKSIYKAAGWDLSDERYLQIQGLLAAMPLTLADGLGADMERLKRFKTLLSTTAANIAPLQGEYLGGPVPCESIC